MRDIVVKSDTVHPLAKLVVYLHDLDGPRGSLDLTKGRRSPNNIAQLRRSGCWLTVWLLLLGSPALAHAQIGGSPGGRQKDQKQTPQQSPATTSPESLPQPWPRLEVGAVLCKSRDDLVRYQARIADGGNPKTREQTSKCNRIPKQVGIQILDHDGPSRTQITTTDESKQTGWTNAYLSAGPPPTR